MNCLVFVVSLFVGYIAPLSAQLFELNGPECGISRAQSLIINGTAAAPGQFPWMVYLKLFKSPVDISRCGGTIITRRHVLTAAHCLVKRDGTLNKVEVLYGNTNVRKATNVDVQKMLIHHRFTYQPLANDIGIVLVKQPFEYSTTVKPVCLPPSPMNVLGKDAVAPGWGMLSPVGPTTDYLQHTTVRVVPDNRCQTTHKNYNAKSMLCAHNPFTGTCVGDSGGPLFVKVKNGPFVQVGITSYGSHPCLRNPRVFTRVDAFMPWIKAYIGKHDAYEDNPSDGPQMTPAVPFIETYTFSSDDTASEPLERYYPY